MLLFWAPAAKPSGPSNLVAIRFTSYVCIETIRIIPQGIAPFLQEPGVVGATHPSSFSLQLFWNYQNVPQQQPGAVEKPKAAGSLASASLRYGGEMLDYQLEFEEQVSTKLLVLQGDFECISLAIYGEPAGSPAILQPNAISPTGSRVDISRAPLPPSIDVAHASDPLLLARQLLSLCENPPPLDDMIAQLYETPGEEEQPVFHGLPSVNTLPLDPAECDEWLGNFVQQMEYLYQDPVIPLDTSPQDQPLLCRACFGIFSLSVVLVWAVHAEQNALVTKALLILRLWESSDEYNTTLRSIASKTLLPTLARIKIWAPASQADRLASGLLAWLLSSPSYVFQPGVLSTLGEFSQTGTTTTRALPQVVEDVASGTISEAIDLISAILSLKAEDIHSTDFIKLSFAAEKLYALLAERDEERTSSLEWGFPRSQELPYLLLDVCLHICGTFGSRIAPITPTSPPVSERYSALFCDAIASSLRLFQYIRPFHPTTTRIANYAAKATIISYQLSSLASAQHEGQPDILRSADNARKLAFDVISSFCLPPDRNTGLSIPLVAWKELLLSQPPFEEDSHVTPLLITRAESTLPLIVKLIEAASTIQETGPVTRQLLVELLSDLGAFAITLSPGGRKSLIESVTTLDDGYSGIGEWLMVNEVKNIDACLKSLSQPTPTPSTPSEDTNVRVPFLHHEVTASARCLRYLLLDDTGSFKEQVGSLLVKYAGLVPELEECSLLMLEGNMLIEDMLHIIRAAACEVIRGTSTDHLDVEAGFCFVVTLVLLRAVRLAPAPSIALPSALLCLAYKVFDEIVTRFPSFMRRVDFERLQRELGLGLFAMMQYPSHEWGSLEETALYISSFLDFLKKQQQPDTVAINEEDEYDDEYAEYDDNLNGAKGLVLTGLGEGDFDKLAAILDSHITGDAKKLIMFKPDMGWSDGIWEEQPPLLSLSSASLVLPQGLNSLRNLLEPSAQSNLNEHNMATITPPSTPPSILGLLSLSPFTVLRSPTTSVSSLTKTYTNNDFRQLRNSPHINTSRPPSMHVDDFQVPSDSPPRSMTSQDLLLQSHVSPGW